MLSQHGARQHSSHPKARGLDTLPDSYLHQYGGVILDATIGSGTTAVAAIKEKRHFIGFELNKEYFDKAQQRINKIRQNPEFDFKL